MCSNARRLISVKRAQHKRGDRLDWMIVIQHGEYRVITGSVVQIFGAHLLCV